MSDTISHYSRLMGQLSIASLCVSLPVTLAILIFALLALRSQPRIGALLIAWSCLLSLVLSCVRALSSMLVSMHNQMDTYFRIQIALSLLGPLNSLLMGAGVILVLYHYVLPKARPSGPPAS